MFLTVLWNEEKLCCTLWQGKERLSDRVWMTAGATGESFSQAVKPWLEAHAAVPLEVVVWQKRQPENTAASETTEHFAKELASWSGGNLFEVPLWWEEELPYLARYSGFPGIVRQAVYDKVRHEAALGTLIRQGELPKECILANFEEATTIAAYRGTSLLDCNNGRDGEGPMGLSYSGLLPTEPLIQFAFQSGKPLSDLEHKLLISGWVAYQGMLKRQEWEEIWMYQVLKEIGAMQAVLRFRAQQVFATGILAQDSSLMKRISERLPWPLRLEVISEDLSLGLACTWCTVSSQRKEEEDA